MGRPYFGRPSGGILSCSLPPVGEGGPVCAGRGRPGAQTRRAAILPGRTLLRRGRAPWGRVHRAGARTVVPGAPEATSGAAWLAGGSGIPGRRNRPTGLGGLPRGATGNPGRARRLLHPANGR